jgi:CheY-like chemotaxis protein
MVSIGATLPALEKMPSSPERLVLQVEDNPANANVVKQLLARRSDLTLRTATDGHQCIEMAGFFLPDIILLDMKMPGLSGLEVLSILRGNPASSHIPVIALSSNAYPSDIKKCLEAGAFQYLTKPYKIEDLMAAIDAALLYAAQNRPTTECRTAMTQATVAECRSAMLPIPSGAVGRIRL